MEVKINKEIREYSESIFFGLNLRQLIFSLLAMGDRKSTRLNSSHSGESRMPSSA